MGAFVASLLFVTLAEMGDKTQLLAMAMATQFPAATVLLGVFVATVLNHAVAVAVGRLLVTIVPLEAISLVAALSFIVFGLWTLRGDRLEGEENRRSRYGALATVAIAFFLAELGDKTQLATISLAVKYDNAVGVLFGTTTGMLVADSVGICIGVVLGKRLPNALIRWGSAGIFMVFGWAGAARVLSGVLPLGPTALLTFLLAVGTLVGIHTVLLRRQPDGHAEGSVRRWRMLPQWAFLGILIVAWLSGLGPVRALSAVDHWLAFLVLVGLGWCVAHGAVRRSAWPFDGYLASAVIALAATAGLHAYLNGLTWVLAIIPILLLALAATVRLCPAIVLPRTRSPRLQTVWQRRGELASGLALFATAVLILLEHLA